MLCRGERRCWSNVCWGEFKMRFNFTFTKFWGKYELSYNYDKLYSSEILDSAEILKIGLETTTSISDDNNFQWHPKRPLNTPPRSILSMVYLNGLQISIFNLYSAIAVQLLVCTLIFQRQNMNVPRIWDKQKRML